jgi:hypothetical protein
MHITKLYSVFEIFTDEAQAIHSFRAGEAVAKG